MLKRLITTTACAPLLLTLLMTSSLSTQAQDTVQLMANTSPPYADVKLPNRGLALEIVEHVFSRTDYQADITIESWSRAIEGASIGVYDGLAAAWYTPERGEDLLFSEPYLSSKLIIVKRLEDRGRFRQLSDLAGRRLGVRADYAYGIDFSTVPGLTLVEENHLIQNLLNLMNGSVDFVIGDQRTMTMQLHEYMKDRITRFEVLPIDLPSPARHVATSRELAGHEKIITEFNKALAEAKRDGSYNAILKKWDSRYEGI
ncbi:MAG: transporter substrate-binding domain-containing protein [Halioglobus sp.]